MSWVLAAFNVDNILSKMYNSALTGPNSTPPIQRSKLHGDYLKSTCVEHALYNKHPNKNFTFFAAKLKPTAKNLEILGLYSLCTVVSKWSKSVQDNYCQKAACTGDKTKPLLAPFGGNA